ncbi:unnamed protein product [Auanema sp. JU1783]|nr:unnamed protein product [Auanema sp. JU1783]
MVNQPSGEKTSEIQSQFDDIAGEINSLRKEIRQEANPFLIIKAERLAHHLRQKAVLNSFNTMNNRNVLSNAVNLTPVVVSKPNQENNSAAIPIGRMKQEKKTNISSRLKSQSKEQKMDQILTTLLSPVFLPFVVLTPVVSPAEDFIR